MCFIHDHIFRSCLNFIKKNLEFHSLIFGIFEILLGGFYILDHLGSTSMVLDADGNISQSRTEKAKAQKEGLTQKEFNDRMNDPNLYQIEGPHSNRSHKFEAKKR